MDFSRIILADQKAVMAVIRPVRNISAGMNFSPPSELINSVSTGFFRISFGRKNRFIAASEPALKILGFSDLRELMSYPVESLFSSPGQLIILKNKLSAREPVLNMVLNIKTRTGVSFNALVSVVVVEQNYPELWCEGTIEYISPSENEDSGAGPLPPRYYSSFIMESPVTAIMKPLPDHQPGTAAHYVGSDKSIAFAYDLMSTNRVSSLLVTADDGSVAGIITESDILYSLSSPWELIADSIIKASGADELKKVYLRMQEITILLVLGKADPLTVSSFISGIADMICEKALTLSLGEAGPPPCRFAFIQTGSAGRMEQALFTDQDNAIIFEDLDDKLLPGAKDYFTKIGRRVNEILAETGYNLCKGNNMAGNSEWCQPLAVWKKYFSDWIRIPDPQNLLEISIFFDFRHCYGDPSLTDELHGYISTNIITSDIFFHHMASALKVLKPSAGNLESEKTDIKKLMMPLTGTIRLYSLKHGINAYSTTARIIALHEAGHLNLTFFRDLIRAWRDLSQIRLSHQVRCLINGRNPDNTVDLVRAGA